MATITELTRRPVRIWAEDAVLDGDLNVPPEPSGIVLFAHGSGSSRHSSRNRFVAEELNRGGMATLLFDLLSSEEERVDQVTAELRFNIDLLARRLLRATEAVVQDSKTASLPVAYFGASTGGGAALVAAAHAHMPIAAIVSRGGRPDLAGEALRRVNSPTLLIVGGDDHEVIELNRQAMDAMTCEKRLEIVPGATHLFEEPGALEQVASLARGWFEAHFSRAQPA